MSDLTQAQPTATKSDEYISWADAIGYGALALAGAWFGYFLFTGMPQLTLEVFPRTLTVHLIFGALALVYVAYLAIARRLPGGTPIDLAVAGLVFAYTLATFTSINWRASTEMTLLVGATIVAFYALSDLPYLTATSLRRAFMLVGVALAGYAMWVVGNDYVNYLQFIDEVEGIEAGNVFPPTVPRVHDVSDHPNVLAMVLTLIVPFFAMSAFRASSGWERALGWIGLFCAGWAAFLTLSRGGWLGIGAGVAFTLLGCWLTKRAFDREEQGFAASWENLVPRDISPTAIAAIGGAIVLVAGGTLAYLSSSATRPGWLFRSSLSPREDAWRAGLDMFGDYPLVGSGPNTFGLLYPQYSGKFLVHTQHAHNGFLQAANDMGLIGLVALAFMAATVVFMLIKTWREGSLEQRFVAIAIGGALIGFSLHNQLDAGNIWKAPAIALAVVGAIMVRQYRERDRSAAIATPDAIARLPEGVRRYAPMALRGGLLLLLFVPFVAWFRLDAAHRDYWQGLDAFNRGDAAGLAQMQDAVNGDSSMMAYQMALGQAQATQFKRTGETDRALIDAAIVHLEQAVRIDKRSDLARANLARAYQLAGREEDAAREANLVRLAVHHVPPVLAAGEVYEDMGYDDEAIATYAQVIGMDAGLADSSYWETSEWRREHFDEIIESSALGANPCTFGSYLVHAHRSDASASLDGLDDAIEGCKINVVNAPNDLIYRAALGRMLTEKEEYDEAFIHLDYAVSRQPDFAPARTELGRWHAARGDIEHAKHEWVIAGQLEDAEAIMLLGDTYPPGDVPEDLVERLATLLGGSGTSVQNDIPSVLYYRLRYGRLSPLDAMIPAEWQSAVPRIYQDMRNKLTEWRNEGGRAP